MTALDALLNIGNSSLAKCKQFRYCLVDESKHPFRLDETIAKPNCIDDFSELTAVLQLPVETLEKYRCLGISIQASKVCAIDVDHCADIPFDVCSINPFGNALIALFSPFAYIEFSFSGTGLRILFNADKVEGYEEQFYTKNSRLNVEFYYPEGSNRYVTLTGRSIVDNPLNESLQKANSALHDFLIDYMRRPAILKKHASIEKDDRPLEELMKIVKMKYMTDFNFQELWFNKAPGSGHDESERDYHLVAFIYDFVTKDKDKIKQVFEQSPFFKSKDWKHVSKWNKQDFRYFNYLYEKISSKGE